jgi:RNA polymerase sigma-70 factor (ECF subfamily)
MALLVAKVRQGDPQAGAVLVGRYLKVAYAVALAIVRRPQDAEDIAQDSFIAAFEQLDTCRNPDRFGSWLLQIVRNRARNALERRQLRERHDVVSEEPFALPQTDTAGLREKLLAALDELPPIQREIVLLHDLGGWTHGEISQALELSDVNCRQHLFQARRKLRGMLADVKPVVEPPDA